MSFVIRTYANPVKYVPDVLGNRRLKTPWYVLIEPCSAVEFDNLTQADADASKSISKTLIKERVAEVCGLVFDLDGKSKLTPVDGSSLLDALDKSRLDSKRRNDIVNDLVKAIIDHSHLSEGELDRFVSQSE